MDSFCLHITPKVAIEMLSNYFTSYIAESQYRFVEEINK